MADDAYYFPIHCAFGRTGDTLAPMDVEMRKWTNAEIRGPDDRVELLGGAMICKELQHSPHAGDDLGDNVFN